MKKRNFIIWFLPVLMLYSCYFEANRNNSNDPGSDNRIIVTDIGINPSALAVAVGGTYQLTAEIMPENAANQVVTWETSNASVATVSSTGLVSGISLGNAVIMVTAEEGGKSATCNVTVLVLTASVTLNTSSVTIGVGDTIQLTETVSPADAANKNVTWSSSDTSTASVSSTGFVTGKAIGSAVITVTTEDGGHTATCNVTVVEASVSVYSVSLDITSVNLYIDETQQLTKTVYPSTAANKNVSWSSSDSSIASVSTTGLVTANAMGNAVMTVTTEDGNYTATCTVNVALKYLTQWGSNLLGNGHFNRPEGIASDSSGYYIFVADTNNHRIQVFYYWGNYYNQWGSYGNGDGQFMGPSGIAIDGDDYVYVTDRNNNRIQKFNSYGYYITQWGGSGTGDGQFSGPTGIAVDSGNNIYVVDNYNHRIQKFDSNGTYITQWGSNGTGDGQFTFSYQYSSLSVDSSNNIYVADVGNNRVQKFDSDGTYIIQWNAGSDVFNYPTGIAIDASNNIYVSERYGYRIQKFNSDGVYQNTQWGSWGNADGQFMYPSGITANSYGIFVVDNGNYRIQRFDSDGVFLAKWGSDLYSDGMLKNPYGIAVDSNNYIYIVDTENYRIQKFDSYGTYITQWGNSGSGDGEFGTARGIAIDGNDNVYVTDVTYSRIQKFNSNGIYLTQWGSPGSGNGQFNFPNGIAIDSDNNVYVTDCSNDRVQKFDNNGGYITQWGSHGSGDGQFDSPTGIVLDSNNNIYVADSGNNRIEKFNSAGTYSSQWSTGYSSNYYLGIDIYDNIFVTHSSFVTGYNSDGEFLTEFGTYGTGNGEFGFSWGVAFDSNGNIYVVDTTNCRIQKFGE